MQGTGTQTDPYYPTNWSEFVTVLTNKSPASGSTKYISCPENGEWDMYEILPEGLTSNVGMWGGSRIIIYGNGTNIKKLHFNGGYFGSTTQDIQIDVYNLNFLNMSTSGRNDNMFYFDVRYGYVKFHNCKFSGFILKGAVFYYSKYSYSCAPLYITRDTEKGSTVNFNFAGEGCLCNWGSSDIRFEYSRINFSGKSTYTYARNENDSTVYAECWVMGNCPWSKITLNGYNNVYDIEISENTTVYTATSSKTSIINSDKFNGTYYYGSCDCIPVTSLQFSDIEYLQSKSFSIAG